MRNLVLLSVSLFLIVTSQVLFANTNEYPGRLEFPEVPIYESSQLNDAINDVIVVDTRSIYEFETLRIKGSINIPVAKESFESDIQNLRNSQSKPIVFYCNGKTCFKSYLAVKKSTKAGVQQTYAYDAGIFEWAVKHPEKSVLLGKSPINIKHLIHTSKLKDRLLDPNTFSKRATTMGTDSIVLDVRDKYQRAGIGFFPGKERWVSLDNKKKLDKYLKKAKDKNKTLFIYDEVGKQVRWLQYTLEQRGIKNYYFMDKGAKAYYADISNWK